jgi:hypothetical protein
MFSTIRNGLSHLGTLNEAAYRDWEADNFEGCITRLEEAAEDCVTLATQIRRAIADAKAQPAAD